jgi:hypothetical protein
MYSFNLCLSLKVFISPLILKDNFAGYSDVIGSSFLSGLEVCHSMPSWLWDSDEKSGVF